MTLHCLSDYQGACITNAKPHNLKLMQAIKKYRSLYERF